MAGILSTWVRIRSWPEKWWVPDPWNPGSHVLGDIKHYALNDQESGRNAVNVHIDERSMRESDLLAFEIGIREGHPAAVMCSYNRVNGDYACENKYLLTDVLKKDWDYKGFVVSDWQATHSTAKASAAGLDHEEPGEIFFGEALKEAVQSGKVPMSELDDHVRRVLRSMFATGDRRPSGRSASSMLSMASMFRGRLRSTVSCC